MFSWDGVAHQCTFGRRLKQLSWRDNLALEAIVTELSRRVKSCGKMLVAIDSTVDTVFGEKIQGAERGYNPHKPGRNSYHPLLAVDVASRSVVDGYLRPGSCASNDGLDGSSLPKPADVLTSSFSASTKVWLQAMRLIPLKSSASVTWPRSN